MMKRKRIVLFAMVAFLASTLILGAAAPPKFRPSNSGDSGAGRYVITLADDAVAEDVAAMKREVALLYGAKLEVNASTDVRQFAVTMTPARARLLSTDPRVSEVVEVSSASAPATPSPTPASPARHFTTQASGYGDNGQSGTYTYDSSGNITAIGTDTYLYDLEDRLHSSVTRGVTETYIYDAFGNRQSAAGAVNCLGQTTCAQPVTLDEHTNRLQTINGAAVQYDTAGNLTSVAAISNDPGATYNYDGTGMMIRQTVGSDDRQFIYTADDERLAVRKGLSWTWTVRDPSHKVVREFTSLETPNSGFVMTNRQWAKDYIWRDGLLLATTTSSGTLHYHLDHLGTPRLVTNASGAKAAEHAYYPFGAEIALTPHEAPEEAMKFTGHERDIVAGDGHTLDYMHARYYNASVGRFLSVDRHDFWRAEPGSQAAQENMRGYLQKPQNWNRYAHVLNNPLGLTDPTGETWLDVIRNTLDWALGRGSEHKVYVQPSNEVADLKNAPEVNRARQFFLQKNATNIANKQPLQPVTNFAGKFGPKGLVKAGTNSTQQFVGSFSVDIRPEPSGMVRYTITNTTSFQSLMYGIAPNWDRSTFSPGGNVDQVYTWTEKAP